MSALHPTSVHFKQNAREALENHRIQAAMTRTRAGFQDKRAKAVKALPEFDAIRDSAKAMKDHVLAHLADYLEQFERNAQAGGTVVHWANDAAEARAIVLSIAKRVKARTVNKGKSMISEEIALNPALEAAGLKVLETDLGEYIIQLRGEAPSHIIAPAVHVSAAEVEADFRKAHSHLPADRQFPDAASLVREARLMLRRQYFGADLGITGANMLIAETGQSVIVTNEGNGDLTQQLARVHITLASIEKIVPTLDDAATVLRLLGRSATGQEMSVYTTFSRGPRRAADPDGPEECHVILLDNGRSGMIGSDFQEMLRCIRCAACMNHCPVYQSIGGHAYGWVYPGPMGSVLTPSLIGVEQSGALPNASTFCGRCEQVCPMRIPLPKMMRHWREREFERHLAPATTRWGIRLWAALATRPRLYRLVTGLAARGIRLLGRGFIRRLPLAKGWTDHRDFPAPAAQSFMSQYRNRQ